jgi:hypothetical protein
MRGLVLGMVVLLGGGVADAKPCPKGTSRIGKKCVIDRWKPSRAAPRKRPPIVTLAAFHPAHPTLDDDTQPVEATPTAGALYHAAQLYKHAGENAKALELYDKYLLVAPKGPAAPAVRAQIEKLRAAP